MASDGRHVASPRGLPGWLLGLVAIGTTIALVVLVLDAALVPPEPPLARQHEPVVVPAPINELYEGVSTFRGNASRTYYGEGPVPADPRVAWRIPTTGPACRLSAEGLEGTELKEWCGTGWTGQPNVVPGADGMQVRVGMFDGAYHFVDAVTGEEMLAPLQTDDLAKGSATTDPDDPSLYYAGSRDNRFRVIATDRDPPWSYGRSTRARRSPSGSGTTTGTGRPSSSTAT